MLRVLWSLQLTNDAVLNESELNEAVLNATARQNLISKFSGDERKLLDMKASNRDVARLYVAYHLADNEVRRNAPGSAAASPTLLAEATIDRQFLKDRLHAILRDG
ncbi:MAG: hypothetical protein SV422_06120 [Pseudomonadota bacterium]|nr:hypothetical protein [Pseudomonadota bacterium]